MSGMTGVILVSGASLALMEITVSTPGSGFFGYTTAGSGLGAAGTCTGLCSVRGASIERLGSFGTIEFQVQLNGTNPQNRFTGVRVEDSTGAIRTYLSSAASYSQGSDALWSWQDTTAVYPSDGPTLRTVEFF
jgi:hypothetical protein